jgi:hypothetical protein
VAMFTKPEHAQSGGLAHNMNLSVDSVRFSPLHTCLLAPLCLVSEDLAAIEFMQFSQSALVGQVRAL